MCTHFQTAIPEEFRQDVLILNESGIAEQAYPGRTVPVVIWRDGSLSCVPCRWGLIPHWAPDTKLMKSTFNARGETIHEKPSFRDSFRGGKRCILRAKCFHENIYAEGTRKRLGEAAITLASGAQMHIAGLYAINTRIEPQPVWSCTMITTSANEVIQPFNDRMPVILTEAESAEWLNPATDVARLRELLRPCPTQWLVAERV